MGKEGKVKDRHTDNSWDPVTWTSQRVSDLERMTFENHVGSFEESGVMKDV